MLNPYNYFPVKKEKSLKYNFWAALYRAVLDYFWEGLGYHAAATSFYTLMSFFPLLLFLTVGISYIASVNTDMIISVLEKFFPDITKQFVELLLSLTEKRTIFGFLGLAVSFYFASNIFTSLHTAFEHIFEREESVQKKALIYMLGVPVFTLTLLAIYFLGSFISFALSIIQKFQLWKYIEEIFGTVHLKFLLDTLTNVGMVVQFLGFCIILFVLYKYIAPHLIYDIRVIFYVSIFVAGLLFVLSMMFNEYILIASKANPVYGALSGIFAFLAWLYISYGIILIGGRMLFYLETLENQD
ncbi:YihY/virulence factor BrkB family protein [Persephonella sp.]